MPVIVPQVLRAEMIESEATFIREIPRWDPAAAIDSLIRSAGGAFALIEPFLTEGSRVLEIGSGNGLGLCDLLSRGVDAIGLEPGRRTAFEGRHERAKALLAANHFPAERIVEGIGERLPFPDGSFDIVFSIAVLEHVADVRAVLGEAIRVTRRGGVVIMNVPNYFAWYEAHYDGPWLPPLIWSRRAARAFLRLSGRPDYYLDELRFVTPWSIMAALGSIPGVSVRIWPFMAGRASRISALGFYLSEGETHRHPVISALRRHRALSQALSVSSRSMSAVALTLGLCFVFNVVIEVQSRR